MIEIDGSQYFTSQGKAYDAERSMIMQQYGIETIRFSNADIDRNFKAVCDQIHYQIQSRIQQYE